MKSKQYNFIYKFYIAQKKSIKSLPLNIWNNILLSTLKCNEPETFRDIVTLMQENRQSFDIFTYTYIASQNILENIKNDDLFSQMKKD